MLDITVRAHKPTCGCFLLHTKNDPQRHWIECAAVVLQSIHLSIQPALHPSIHPANHLSSHPSRLLTRLQLFCLLSCLPRKKHTHTHLLREGIVAQE